MPHLLFLVFILHKAVGIIKQNKQEKKHNVPQKGLIEVQLHIWSDFVQSLSFVYVGIS